MALIVTLRDALDGCFERKPGRLGVRHLRDTCRLSARIAMSDKVDDGPCIEARAALDAADARLGYVAWAEGA